MQFLLLTQGGNSRMIEEVDLIVESLLASQRRENRMRRQSSVQGLGAGILKRAQSIAGNGSAVSGPSSRPGSPEEDLFAF